MSDESGHGDARVPGYTRPMPDPAALPEPEHEAEVRPLPVLAEPRPVQRAAVVTVPAAIVAATGGFLLGVATFVLVRVLRRPRASMRPGRARKRDGKRVDVAATRSFLIDVHLLKDR